MPLKLAQGVGTLAGMPFRARLLALFTVAAVTVLVLSYPSAARAPIVSTERTIVGHDKDGVAVEAVTTTKAADVPPSGKAAKIVTCPRCRLNRLPLVRNFVYQHAKLFEPGLKVDFILGESPVLHLYSDGEEVEEVDLAPLDGKQIIQKLVKFGIKPSDETAVIREALGTRR